MSVFNLPLFLFYDNSDNKKKAGMKTGKDNIAMFLKSKLISFSDDRYATSWKNEVMADEHFVLEIPDELLLQYAAGKPESNEMIYNALVRIKSMGDDEREVIIKAHHSKATKSLYEEYEDGSYRWKYHYVQFSPVMVRGLSELFVSTVVYNAQGIKWPVKDDGTKELPEGMIVEFNTDSHRAKIIEINVMSSIALVPFQSYINDVLSQIWDEIEYENPQKTDELKAVDFYTDLKVDRTKKWGMWHPVKDLDDALNKGMVAPYGIYMLYDSTTKRFYIGKAKEVYKRINEHRHSKNPNEPMKKFDFYRYSLVDPNHRDKIYLIENASIHDCAAIFNMPNAKTGRLNKISLQNHVTNDLNGIILTNTYEAQTRWE